MYLRLIARFFYLCACYPNQKNLRPMKIRFAALVPVLFAVACGSDPADNNGNDSLKSDSVTIEQDSSDMEAGSSLPNPLHIATMFKRSGLKYLPGITNGNEKASGYQGTFIQAQNMGVYSADMAYCVTNKQTNEAQKYLKTVRDLGTQINLGSVFSESDLYDRFNKNLDNDDSLGKIVIDIQYKTDKQFDLNQQSHMTGVIFAGAWVESMYIGSQVYRKDGNENVVAALLEQMAVCESILKELNAYKDADPGMAGLIANMQKIQNSIDSMPSFKKLNEDPNIEFKDVHPTKEELDSVIKTIEEVRALIVNG